MNLGLHNANQKTWLKIRVKGNKMFIKQDHQDDFGDSLIDTKYYYTVIFKNFLKNELNDVMKDFIVEIRRSDDVKRVERYLDDALYRFGGDYGYLVRNFDVELYGDGIELLYEITVR